MAIDISFGILKRRPFASAGAFFLAIVLLTWYRWTPASTLSSSSSYYQAHKKTSFDGVWKYARDKDNLLLDQAQCENAFPGLFDEVDRAVNDRRPRPITVEELDQIEPKNGYIRAMIYDQQVRTSKYDSPSNSIEILMYSFLIKLYVISKQGNIYSRERATLQAIYRAMLSSPVSLPDIEFAFNTDDIIFEKVALWGYARRQDDTHIWVMPDFGYWSWPETKVGTMREVEMKAKSVEKDDGFSVAKKIPKLFWRGATMNLPLRERLLLMTQGKPWADVVALDWHNKESMSNDLKSMPEHCQYKYLAHTEGNSYSGRLKYLQACESVIVAHKMNWIQHHHSLMHSSGPQQNYVEVDVEFNDLEGEIQRLEKSKKEVQRIASNNVKTFRERYLTPAAEACYWRRLIHGWSEVSFQPAFYKYVNGTREWRGLPVESFVLEGRLEWDPY